MDVIHTINKVEGGGLT